MNSQYSYYTCMCDQKIIYKLQVDLLYCIVLFGTVCSIMFNMIKSVKCYNRIIHIVE